MKKNFIKRLCAISLICGILSGMIHIPAYAFCDMEYPVRYASDTYGVVETLSAHVDLDELRAYLFEAFKDCPEKIDISGFNIPESDADALKAFIWDEMPECFQVYGLGTYGFGKLKYVYASYRITDSGDEYLSMLAECDEKADVLLDGIIGNDGLSDAEKALLIHDRLAVNCRYDYGFNDAGYTMYGALARGLAVCDGYSDAYAYLLRKVGIESLHCISTAMNHAWNLVKIDGVYYHVDVTWDDPSFASNERNYEGSVNHDNFLRSNDGIKTTNHTAGDYYTPANTSKYDDYFWIDSGTEFQLLNGQIYYFDNVSSELKRLNGDGISGTAIYSVSDRWMLEGGSSFWIGNFCRLSSDGHSLLISTSDKIYIFDLNKNEASVLFEPDLSDGENIFGFTYSDGYLVCDINDHPNNQNKRLRQVKQPYIPGGISAEISLVPGIGGSRTVSVEINSNLNISGYYFGKKSEYGESDIVPSNQSALELIITEPGTYYFAAFDEKGNSSDTAELTVCLINLYINGKDSECERLLAGKTETFELPVPGKDGSRFCGWSDMPDAETGTVILQISDPPLVSDYYATWKEQTDLYLKVVTANGAPFTVYALDSDGNITDSADCDGDELTFGVTDEAEFIEITAENHVGAIYRADGLPDNGNAIVLLLLGDVNLDGEVNNKDVAVLFRAVSDADIVYSDAADVNADGFENNKDVAVLFRFLSDPNTKLVPHSVTAY